VQEQAGNMVRQCGGGSLVIMVMIKLFHETECFFMEEADADNDLFQCWSASSCLHSQVGRRLCRAQRR
jgi:hypothetical protein